MKFSLPLKRSAQTSRFRRLFQRFGKSGFTLIEMLVTVSVITVVSAVTVPAMQGVTGGTSITTGARDFSNLINVARSEAIARHTVVRFAIAKECKNDSESSLRKASLWEWNDEEQKFLQITAWQSLPNGVIMESALPDYVKTSSYASADGTSVRGDYVLESTFDELAQFSTEDENIQMNYIEFLPSGSARVPGGNTRNVIYVLTSGLINAEGSVDHPGGEVKNWAQINVDVLTGRVRLYRP